MIPGGDTGPTHLPCDRSEHNDQPTRYQRTSLSVVLDGTGILVSALALRQFVSIIGPVLLALILVIGVHPLTGVLRRRGGLMWLAATVALITLVLVIFGLSK